MPAEPASRRGLASEVIDGLTLVWRVPVLRGIAVATLAESIGSGVVGAIILIFGIRELGFEPGVLGTIFAFGGISSVLSAVVAGRVTRLFGLGPSMIVGLSLFAVSTLMIPLARPTLVVAGLFLFAQQLGDGPMTLYLIAQDSLLQATTPNMSRGRVYATRWSVGQVRLLAGSLPGGALAGPIGLRMTFVVAALVFLLGPAWLLLSPIRAIGDIAASIEESPPHRLTSTLDRIPFVPIHPTSSGRTEH